MVDSELLRVFERVAERASFSAAAEELYTSQPNVSRRIARLEHLLGVRLFDRRGRRVSLTDAGWMLLDYARRTSQLTADLQRRLHEIRDLEAGSVRLLASPTPGHYLLPPLIAAFLARYPGVEVRLDIVPEAGVVRAVREREVDAGFVGRVDDGAAGVTARPFAPDRLVLVGAPPGEASERPRPLAAPDALASERLLLREPGSGTREHVDRALASWGVRPRAVMVVRGPEALKRAAAAGLGVGFLSARAVEWEVSRGLLTVRGGDGLSIDRQLYLLTPKDHHPAPAASAFLALASRRDGWDRAFGRAIPEAEATAPAG